MDTLITSSEINPSGTNHVSATCGRVSAYVGYFRGQHTHATVCCHNSASRHLGAGRTFHGADCLDQALAAYKSPEMKAIIEAARDLFEGALNFDHTPSNIIPFRAA